MKKKLFFVVLVVGGLVYTVYSNLLGRANQASALTTCEAIQHAEVLFHVQNLRYGTLDELIDAGLLRIQLHGNVRNGFRFELRLSDKSYTLTARPLRRSIRGYWGTGFKAFCIDSLGRVCEVSQ